MKRTALLVDYSSSDDGEDKKASTPEPAVKKRKLPALANNLVLPAPVDNPALHQGRIRSSPHIEGQFASYVYVPLRIPRGSTLNMLLDDIFRRAKEIVPTLQPIGCVGESDTQERELHVSLTRPVYLRAHQRDEFRNAVRAICRKHETFAASFTNFAELRNDERTRTFLTIEIGAGHRELETLCTTLTPTLRSYRQKEFYDQPRFHASIAWALLSSTSGRAESLPASRPIGTPSASSELSATVDGSVAVPLASSAFETIPCFPPDLITTLEQEFSLKLRSRHSGTFDADCLCVKIGKDVNRYKLQAAS